MSDLAPEPIVRAASRWLDLLQLVGPDEARGLIRSDPRYTDLTLTQYGQGFDLLQMTGIIDSTGAPTADLPTGSSIARAAWVVEKIIASAEPPWLANADEIVSGPEDLPVDAVILGAALGLDDLQVWSSITNVAGKVDAAHRAELGLAGELALIEYLQASFEVAIDHVSLRTDGLGYDVVARSDSGEWHIEVKSTSSRARLVVYLSRNEYEVSRRDPNWVLVAVALDEARTLLGLGTVDTTCLDQLMPRDQDTHARWQAAKLKVDPDRITAGVPFLAMAVPGLGPERAEGVYWL